MTYSARLSLSHICLKTQPLWLDSFKVILLLCLISLHHEKHDTSQHSAHTAPFTSNHVFICVPSPYFPRFSWVVDPGLGFGSSFCSYERFVDLHHNALWAGFSDLILEFSAQTSAQFSFYCFVWVDKRVTHRFQAALNLANWANANLLFSRHYLYVVAIMSNHDFNHERNYI